MIGISILVEYSVGLSPRWLLSKGVKIPGVETVVRDEVLVVGSRWVVKWSSLVRDISFCPLLWTAALGLHPAPLNFVIYIGNCQHTVTEKLFCQHAGCRCCCWRIYCYGTWDGALEDMWTCWACSTSWVPCCFPVEKAAFMCGLVRPLMNFACWRLRTRSFNRCAGVFTEPAFRLVIVSCLKQPSVSG